jgi:hypothetical protein
MVWAELASTAGSISTGFEGVEADDLAEVGRGLLPPIPMFEL